MFLTDLATVEPCGEDLEQAYFSAGEAAGQHVQAGYATNASPLREFRARRRQLDDSHSGAHTG